MKGRGKVTKGVWGHHPSPKLRGRETATCQNPTLAPHEYAGQSKRKKKLMVKKEKKKAGKKKNWKKIGKEESTKLTLPPMMRSRGTTVSEKKQNPIPMDLGRLDEGKGRNFKTGGGEN